MNFLSLLQAVAPVFLIIAAGCALRRLRWLTSEADRSLLLVGVNVLYPCLIADSILGNAMLAEPENLIVPPLIGFGTVIFGFIAAGVVARLMRLPGPTRGSFTFTTGLYNYGYLPIPLVQAFYDQDTLGVLFTHNLGVEIALWTVGIWLLSGSSASGSWKQILNVPIVVILATAALNFAGGDVLIPTFVKSALHMLGQSAIPLALLLTGATLGDLVSGERGGSRVPALVASNILRLGLLPLSFLLLAKYLPVSVELQRIIIIQAAMPAAMIPIILARHYNADSAHALQIVLTTTLLSLVTIPLWLRFGFWWVGP
ncbi:MAG: AEC family transporter [Chthoniobacteraceae bacterium]